MFVCARCLRKKYCSKECQIENWDLHKKECFTRADRKERRLILKEIMVSPCVVCCTSSNSKRCDKCRNVRYCSKQCQTKDWDNHKNTCVKKKNVMGEKKRITEMFTECIDLEMEKRKISNTNMLREGAICEQLGNIYTTLGHLNKALESYYKCLFLTQDETMKQHVLSCIAFVHGDMGDLKKTSESLDLISNMDNTDINYIINYNYIGGAYEKIGDYETARTYYNAQLKHDKCSARCNLGRIYCHLKLYKKAIDYSESALCMENISQEIECEAYKNIGLAYSNLREFDAAMHNFEKSLSIVEARRSDESQLYGEMAFIYFIKENFEKAIDFNIRAINIAFEIGQRNNECTLHGDLSDVYEYMGLFEEATKSRQKQLIIAKEMNYVSKQDFIQEKIDYNSKQLK